MTCTRCGHDRSDHEHETGPCDVKHGDGTHCVCYQYQPRPDIESREESVAFWYRAANREELLGNRATALTYRNMGWLLEHPEGWTQFIGKEKVEAGLDQLLNVD